MAFLQFSLSGKMFLFKLSAEVQFAFHEEFHGMRDLCLCVALLMAVSIAGTAQTTSEQRTDHYLQSIRKQPSLALAFLRDMPKGGDLHVHLSGAIYAEDLIDDAANDNLCVDRTTAILIAPPCDASCEKYTSKPAIRCAYGD